MHEVYESGQASNKEIQRVVDNLFLIKILKKEKMKSIIFHQLWKNFSKMILRISNIVF